MKALQERGLARSGDLNLWMELRYAETCRNTEECCVEDNKTLMWAGDYS